MSLLGTFVRYEWSSQLRSLRYRLIGGLYVLAGSAPVILFTVNGNYPDIQHGPASFAEQNLYIQPFLTVLLAVSLSFDGILREQREGSWHVLSLAATSNSGYLWRRWLAGVSTLLPLTAVPTLVAAACAWADGAPPTTAAPFLWPWLLHTVPLCLAFSALALALGTLTGGVIGALVVYFLGKAVLGGLLGRGLGELSMRWTGFGEWTGQRLFNWGLTFLGSTFDKNRQGWDLNEIPSSEGPFDVKALFLERLLQGGLGFASSFALLAVAAFFLRRTVGDVRPWPVPQDHPLRSFRLALNRFRERYRPEPRPALQDFAVLALALTLVAAVATHRTGRFQHYLQRAEERYIAETGDTATEGDTATDAREAGLPAPNPPELSVESYRLRGRILDSGEIESSVAMALRNRGDQPLDRVALSLDPALRLTSLGASTGEVPSDRSWDRLILELHPPLAGGETRELEFGLRGTPGSIDFEMPVRTRSHADGWEQFKGARFAHDLSDISRSTTHPSVTPGRITLTGQRLLPLPRYTPWTLTPPGTGLGGVGREVPQETFSPLVELDLELEGPAGRLLLSSCGDVATPVEGEPTRLRSSCLQGLDQLAVFGGAYDALREASTEGVTIAVLSAHRRQAELHQASLFETGGRAADAWPGLDTSDPLIFLEWPPPFGTSPLSKQRYWHGQDLRFSPLETFGNVVLIPERSFVSTGRIEPDTLLARLTAARLSQRRTLKAEESVLLGAIFEHCVLHRLGLLESDSATLAAAGPYKEQLRSPILRPGSFRSYSEGTLRRLRALLNYLLWRVGAENAYRSVDSFLTPSTEDSAGEGTLDEFLAELEKRSGQSLQGFREEFLASNALPEIALGEVVFRRVGSRWQVSGEVRNQGTGAVLCPLVVTTDLNPAEQVVTIGAETATSFTIETPYRPQAVTLDPQGRCFRYAQPGLKVRVENRS